MSLTTSEFRFVFDPDAKLEPPKVVYHGTRVAPQIIREHGLQYPGTDMLLKMIEKSMGVAGLDYSAWFVHQQKLDATGKFNTLHELRGTHRTKIWVTDSESNAKSYASHAPEIVNEALRNEYFRLHSRRKNVIEEVNDLTTKSTAWIGNPVVVVLDAVKIGARFGCNQPIAPAIPASAIIDIVDG